MPFPLYKGLSDDFDRHDGTLRPYVDFQLVNLPIEKHNDIRAFHSSNVTVPWTLNDNTWWTGYRYPTFGVGQIGTQRSVVNITSRGRTQAELDTFTQTVLDALTQDQIENVGITSGNEEWPTGDANVTVAKDSAYRYSNTIRITLPAINTQKIVNSYYLDDLSTDFQDDGTTYYVELTLRSLPAQVAAQHLDLANSYIDMSSDVNFDPQYTDSFKFADSLNSLSAGGDTFARWPRSTLVKVAPNNIKAIRFRIQSTGSAGSMTFIAQALRLVPSGWTNRIIGLDTKRGTLARQVPQAGGSESASLFGDMYFEQTRPKVATTYIKFNSGHLPATGSDDNTIRQFFRYNPTTGDRIEVRLSSRSGQTVLQTTQKIAGVTTTLNTNTGAFSLTAETDYYLVVQNKFGPGSNVIATVYLANGLALGTQIINLAATSTITARGYLGFSFEPYMYDFTMAMFGTETAHFGQFQSANFQSRSLVKGATIYPRTTLEENMLVDGVVQAFADATVTTTDNVTYTVQRGNVSNQGGVRYSNPVWIGTTNQIVLTGKIFPVTAVNGTYRISLIDENDSVLWMYNLSGLLPNQWNEFDVLLPANLIPGQYYYHVQQSGFFADTFRVRELGVLHNTVGWEATIDGGTTWLPFLNAINDRWSGLRFASPGISLGVRATAYSDHASISGYNLVPRYVN